MSAKNNSFFFPFAEKSTILFYSYESFMYMLNFFIFLGVSNGFRHRGTDKKDIGVAEE